MSYDADAMHADLARANLLRLRGEFAAAEKLLVEVLEKHPESAAAHTLLGDMAYSQGRADQAVEHYEIASSLDPTLPDLPRKLEDARRLKSSRETASSVEQLGLVPRKPLSWTTFAFVAFAVGCLVTAAMIGFRPSAPGGTVVVRQTAPPIQATPDTLAPPTAAIKGSHETPVPNPAVEPAKASDVAVSPPAPLTAMTPLSALEDRTIFQAVQERSPLGTHLQSVAEDPRTKLAILTYTVASGDDPRKVGAELAKTTLDQSGDTQTVTLRAVRDGRLIYMADILRTKYADTLADDWKQNNPGADAWIAYAVANEWPARSPDTTSTGQ